MPRAFIFLDNIGVKSLVSEEKAEKEGSSHDCVSRAGKDSRIEAVVLQSVGEKGWCGFMMCVVKDQASYMPK